MCVKHNLKLRRVRKYVVQYQCADCHRLFHFDKYAVRLMVGGAVKWQPSFEIKSTVGPQYLHAL